MTDAATPTEYPLLGHSLHRLIKRDDAAGLLRPFLDLMPGALFGMFDPDGRLYAGMRDWDEALVAQAWQKARFGTVVREGALLMRPLIIHNRLAGALLVWDRNGSAELEAITPLIEAVGNGFVRLLEQAVEKRELGSELLDRYREINLLYRAAETIGSCLDPEWIPRLVLDQIQPVVDSDMALVLLGKDHLEADAWMLAADLTEAAWTGSGRAARLLRAAVEGQLERILIVGQPVIFNPPADHPDLRQADDYPAVVMAVPLKVNERVLGALLFGRRAGRPEFTAGDQKLVMALGGQAAIALETARLHKEEVKLQRLEEEMSIGRQIQLSFLPEELPEIPGWDFAAAYRSARQVGGDLYDLILVPDHPERLNLVIADVTGKGVPAALFMAFTRTVLRLISSEGGSPAEVLRKTNQYILQERKSAIFMSAFIASLDLQTGLVRFANAGHDWPLVREQRSGQVRPLKATGYLLGAFEEIEPQEFETSLAPGDVLIFFTDGVTEAFSPQEELYGTPRLAAVVGRQAWRRADELLQAVLDDVENHTAGEQQSDDLTVLVIKRMESTR